MNICGGDFSHWQVKNVRAFCAAQEKS